MNSIGRPGVITSRTFNLAMDDIDTDQIIPAQFLTTTEREGLGRFCFHGWRFDEKGAPRVNDPLQDYRPERQQVLVAGRNFGCGSSREHAPWALMDFGFRAVISTGFADIFRSNALKNGLVPVAVEDHVIGFLLENPDHQVHIDIPNRRLSVDGYGDCEFPLDPFSAYCLTRGIDQLDFILRNEPAIAEYERGQGRLSRDNRT
jgi:3-isopropylmalate/(R)-2-methylmalate dehydratase small subunit